MKHITAAVLILFSLNLTGQNQPVPLTATQRLQELQIIKAAFTSLHPGLYRYNTPSQIEDNFERLSKKLTGDISNPGYFILLSQLSTSLQCGHTYLNPWNQRNEVRERYFSKSFIPFLYKVIDRKLIITHNLSENESIRAGDEIVRINGIAASTIMDSLFSVSRTDGNNGLGKKTDNLNIVPIDIDTSNYSLFDIYFPLFFPENFNARKYVFVISPYKGAPIKTTLRSLTKKERQEIYVSKFGEIPVHEKNWEFRFLNPHAAYLRLGDFETWEWKTDYRKYLDSVFNIIQHSSVKNLILDIRGNEGGDDDARTAVLSYILKKPFGCENRIRRFYKFLSIPDSLQPYLKTWNKEFLKPKKESDFILTADGFYENTAASGNPCIPVNPKVNAFTGKTFLLTNSNNSSTTFTLADLFQQTNSGIIVGETTGGTKQGLNGGQYFFLYLPYSKLEIDIPLIWGKPTLNRKDEGVIPDIVIKTTRKDIRDGRDTQLKFVLSRISN